MTKTVSPRGQRRLRALVIITVTIITSAVTGSVFCPRTSWADAGAISAIATPNAAPLGMSPAPEKIRRETSCPAVSVGIGAPYGTVGLQARYDLMVRPWLQVSPLIAAGLWSSAGDIRVVGATGVGLAVGYHHRFAVDAVLASIRQETLNLHGTVVDNRLLYGPMIALGYELMGDQGRFERLTLGYGFTLWPRDARAHEPPILTLSFGWGLRL